MEKPLKCHLPPCDYICFKASEMKRHFISVHNGKKAFKCDSCKYQSHEMSDLKRHVRSLHDQDKALKCGKCDYSSSRKDQLKKHIESVHEKDKQLKCKICDYSSSRKDCLSEHIKKHHEKIETWNCRICEYTCCKCEKCDYICPQKSTMTKVHEKRKSYKCKTSGYKCEFSSSDMNILLKHIHVIHKGKTLLRCDICDYTCRYNDTMKKHTSSVHEKKARIQMQFLQLYMQQKDSPFCSHFFVSWRKKKL